MKLDEVIQQLRASKRNVRCKDLVRDLESLGFTVSDGKTPGHKVFTHPHLTSFYSSSFNCGHGRNPEIKPAYITKILRTLEEHDAELRAFLESRNST